MEILKAGIGEAIVNYLDSESEETKKAAGFDFDVEERMTDAVENAVWTLTNWNVGKLSDIKEVLQQYGKSHVAKGYFMLIVGGFVYSFCNSLMLERHKNIDDALESFKGKL